MTNATPGRPSPPGATPEVRLDPLMPAETAAKAEDIGVRKARMAALPMFLLAVLAGAFHRARGGLLHHRRRRHR